MSVCNFKKLSDSEIKRIFDNSNCDVFSDDDKYVSGDGNLPIFSDDDKCARWFY